ncbi:MAG: argininosuccinate lyase [Phycisphaerales bacterium]
MTSPLWQNQGTVDQRAMAYMAGDDVILDRELLPFDIRATRAHVLGLVSIQVIEKSEGGQIVDALDRLKAQVTDGTFLLDARFEDGHSAIEWYLTETLGEIGRRVHLGRSRNDQVAVALRLYMKDMLEQCGELLCNSAAAAISLASTYLFTPMPGYTHMQRAVPSSVGLWMASFGESFTDAAELCAVTRNWLNSCPLGTAAGYGVNLPLAREMVSQELGFHRIQVNPMASQSSRGRLEFQTLSSLWQGMQEVRRLSWDLTLFSAAEYGFVTMGDSYRTGSSIMPNKANPDMAELLRGASAIVGGSMSEIQQILSLPSGYHRDLQLTKPPLIRGCRAAFSSLEFIPDLLETLTIHAEKMSQAIDPPMYATDRAVELSVGGMAFRDAYRTVAEELAEGQFEQSNPEQSLIARVSAGACGDLMLESLTDRVANTRALFDS